jgi:hypothetical protein
LAALLLTVCALLALPQPAMAGAGSDRLNPDETLGGGAAIALAAGTLRMQGDGNSCLFGVATVVALRYPVAGLGICVLCLVVYLRPDPPEARRQIFRR